jgi:aminopeptidase N
MTGRALAFVAVFAASAVAQDVRPYRPGIDVVDYTITLDLPDTGTVIRGDAVLTLRRWARRDTLVLDLKQLKVQRVLVDDRAVQFERTDSTLLIPLPPTARADTSTYRVRVVYGGEVTDGLVARRDSAGRWTYFGDNWPDRARYWIPSVDHPSDKATVTWNVRTSKKRGRTVVANGMNIGLETGSGSDARLVSRWRESQPIPTYLMVIAAAPLVPLDLGETACGLGERRRCVKQTVYVAPEQWGILPGNFVQAGEIVRYFASLVGPFPYEKLAHLQSSTRFGGMENAGAIFYADALFRSGGVGEGLIAHEVAHQWFGNSVTERDWPHLWLSEGFATYFAALWTQQAHGDSAFRADMARMRTVILADTGAVPNRPVIDTTERNLLALLNRNSYQKGGFVLHMLRAQLGDKAFFAGVQDYYTKHKHKTALTADLQASLERASGRKLGAVFDQWLRRPGYPDVEVSWSSPDLVTRSMAITVKQSDRFGYFQFPLRLALRDGSGATRRVEVSIPAEEETKIELPISGEVDRIDVDPDVQLLARITVRRK